MKNGMVVSVKNLSMKNYNFLNTFYIDRLASNPLT